MGDGVDDGVARPAWSRPSRIPDAFHAERVVRVGVSVCELEAGSSAALGNLYVANVPFKGVPSSS
jgi:hypothetical protein